MGSLNLVPVGPVELPGEVRHSRPVGAAATPRDHDGDLSVLVVDDLVVHSSWWGVRWEELLPAAGGLSGNVTWADIQEVLASDSRCQANKPPKEYQESFHGDLPRPS